MCVCVCVCGVCVCVCVCYWLISKNTTLQITVSTAMEKAPDFQQKKNVVIFKKPLCSQDIAV